MPSAATPITGPVQPVLGQHAGDVGVVVLHADLAPDVQIERVFGRQVVRVQVVGDRLGLDVEQALEVLDPFAERGQRLQVFQVADVVADERLPPLDRGRMCSLRWPPQASSGTGRLEAAARSAPGA